MMTLNTFKPRRSFPWKKSEQDMSGTRPTAQLIKHSNNRTLLLTRFSRTRTISWRQLAKKPVAMIGRENCEEPEDLFGIWSLSPICGVGRTSLIPITESRSLPRVYQELSSGAYTQLMTIKKSTQIIWCAPKWVNSPPYRTPHLTGLPILQNSPSHEASSTPLLRELTVYICR